jgi:hypothetical protein
MMLDSMLTAIVAPVAERVSLKEKLDSRDRPDVTLSTLASSLSSASVRFRAAVKNFACEFGRLSSVGFLKSVQLTAIVDIRSRICADGTAMVERKLVVCQIEESQSL